VDYVVTTQLEDILETPFLKKFKKLEDLSDLRQVLDFTTEPNNHITGPPQSRKLIFSIKLLSFQSCFAIGLLVRYLLRCVRLRIMRIIRYFVRIIAAFGILFGNQICLAFNENDLKTLKVYNSCPGCNLQKANLSWLDLREANLAGADLRKAQLIMTNLRRTNLAGADLAGANLLAASLVGADLSNANFVKANLRAANMTGNDLQGTNFRGAVLVGTNFKDADLSHADLRETWLYEAKLKNTILTGADMSTAKVWYHQIKRAILCNTTTRFWSVVNSGCVAM
jgi:uncharacterized protein YjbI with pentapeptide repeats